MLGSRFPSLCEDWGQQMLAMVQKGKALPQACPDGLQFLNVMSQQQKLNNTTGGKGKNSYISPQPHWNWKKSLLLPLCPLLHFPYWKCFILNWYLSHVTLGVGMLIAQIVLWSQALSSTTPTYTQLSVFQIACMKASNPSLASYLVTPQTHKKHTPGLA